MVYYNEIDQGCSAWLRNLIRAGNLPQGTIDCRPVQKVLSRDVSRFGHCHWFAGIGGWPLALRLAGWPDDRQVWTASLSCQPFSSAGLRKGFDDERHLWPVFFKLIKERKPDTVFGEQVASGDGYKWLSGVQLDLEKIDYAVGHADLPACCVSAPHKRNRLFWVASLGNAGVAERQGDEGTPGEVGELVVANPARAGAWDAWSAVGCGDGAIRRVEPGTLPLAHGVPKRMGRPKSEDERVLRRTECEARSNRTLRLRGYGNAIVPQVAALFIRAYLSLET